MKLNRSGLVFFETQRKSLPLLTLLLSDLRQNKGCCCLFGFVLICEYGIRLCLYCVYCWIFGLYEFVFLSNFEIVWLLEYGIRKKGLMIVVVVYAPFWCDNFRVFLCRFLCNYWCYLYWELGIGFRVEVAGIGILQSTHFRTRIPLP